MIIFLLEHSGSLNVRMIVQVFLPKLPLKLIDYTGLFNFYLITFWSNTGKSGSNKLKMMDAHALNKMRLIKSDLLTWVSDKLVLDI